MIIELIEEAREWLAEAEKLDENWWALGGEGRESVFLSIWDERLIDWNATTARSY